MFLSSRISFCVCPSPALIVCKNWNATSLVTHEDIEACGWLFQAGGTRGTSRTIDISFSSVSLLSVGDGYTPSSGQLLVESTVILRIITSIQCMLLYGSSIYFSLVGIVCIAVRRKL